MTATMALCLVAGCSGDIWNSKNRLDENPLAQFGHKKARDDAKKDDGPNSAYEAGEESLFSLGGAAVLFGSGGGGTQESTETIRANKLFAGAMEVVMFLPIQVANRESGIIATDWKVDADNPHVRYRVNIHITGQEPYGTVRVAVLKQVYVQETWQDCPADEAIALNIAKSIRKHAQTARP